MFEGFSPETVDFLWGIRMNNNRDWFLEHKKDYVNYLYEPMKALGKDLFQPFLDKPGNLLKVSRIYRDARMHHPTPYKESLWICIRQDVEWWAENPCLYFEIRPEGVSYGFILLNPKVSTLEAFRKDIAARPNGITCSCGSSRYGMDVRRSAVDLVCHRCGAKLRIPAATDRDLDDLCCHMKLVIPGRKS